VITSYEHRVPALAHRLTSAAKTFGAGYPLGFIIGPVILFDGWETAYAEMLDNLEETLASDLAGVRFEVISHRFTERAKSVITEVFPGTTVPMDAGERRFKFGQFGYGKYVYVPDKLKGMEEFFREQLSRRFPSCPIDYII
jgi:spore photoproduct lyase